MRPLKSSLLVLVLATVCLAQAPNPLSNPHVRRLGDQLMCLCGCGATITSCNMLGCSHSKPARERLLAMVNSGESDSAILAAFVQENGVEILAKPPAQGFNLLGYVVPFIGIALGLAFVWFVIKRFRKPLAVAGGPEIDDAAYASYQAQIEKDLEKLDR
ncbi:MAG TPA: cytochrome c-type biogenesis protein CcmH [Bryobacteraceae bacterium]|nr:cytochrome c-type biogenesis protein CcmH [Bryobacteraceae bacterium]